MYKIVIYCRHPDTGNSEIHRIKYYSDEKGLRGIGTCKSICTQRTNFYAAASRRAHGAMHAYRFWYVAYHTVDGWNEVGRSNDM